MNLLLLWNPKFVILFTKAHHWSVCWASSIHSFRNHFYR